MAKITVHGGPSIGGPSVVSGGWSNNDEPDQWPAVDEGETGQAAETVDSASDEPREFIAVQLGEEAELVADGEGEAPPIETADDNTDAHVSETDYEAWTVKQLREVLAKRQLSTVGLKPELVEQLRAADAEASDG